MLLNMLKLLKKYDLILIDWTDSFSIGEWLFWTEFYIKVKFLLKADYPKIDFSITNIEYFEDT